MNSPQDSAPPAPDVDPVERSTSQDDTGWFATPGQFEVAGQTWSPADADPFTGCPIGHILAGEMSTINKADPELLKLPEIRHG